MSTRTALTYRKDRSTILVPTLLYDNWQLHDIRFNGVVSHVGLLELTYVRSST